MRILVLLFTVSSLQGIAQFGPAIEVQTGIGVYGGHESSFRICDVDGDGAMDIVHRIWPTGSIIWFKNSDGLGTFVEQDPIILMPNDNRMYDLVDLDLDGDLDAVIYERIGNQHMIRMFENLGTGAFGTPVLIGEGSSMDLPATANSESVGQLICGDLNGDGLPDVIYTTRGGVRWFLNSGDGTFSSVHSLNRGATTYLSATLRLSDMNADGYPDIITSAALSPIELYAAINVSGNADEWDPIMLYAPYQNYENVTMMDIEGDGDVDILDIGTSIEWYESLFAQNDSDMFEYHFVEPGENNGSSAIGRIGCNSHFTVVYGRWPWGSNQFRLWWRHFDDQLGNFTTLSYNESPKAVYYRLADMNNDDHLDLVTWKNDTTKWYPYDSDYLNSVIDLVLPFDTLALNDGPQVLSGGSPEGGIYQLVGSNDTLLVFDPIAAGVGDHQLIYSYTDPFTGCSGIDSTLVVVELSTGIGSHDQDIGIEVFPNPVNDHCTIIFENGPLDLLLIDATGRIIVRWPAASSPLQADLSKVPAGIYLIQTGHGDHHRKVKVVLQ